MAEWKYLKALPKEQRKILSSRLREEIGLDDSNVKHLIPSLENLPPTALEYLKLQESLQRFEAI